MAFQKQNKDSKQASEWQSPYVIGKVDKDTIISEIKKDFEERREARVARELQWQLNKEFLGGNQFCDINTITRQIEVTPFVYDDEEREVFNLIAPKIEARLSKINKAKPVLLNVPASDSHSDVAAAKVGTKILRGTYREIGMQNHFKTSNAWAEVTGTVFHKDVWNPGIGRSIARVGDTIVKEGGISHVVCSSWEIFPKTETVENIEDQKSIFHAKPYFVDEIEDIYGIKTKGRTLDVYNLENSRISVGGMGYTASIQRYVKGKMENAEIVLECSYLPCKKYPNGKLITIIGDELLVYMDSPHIDSIGNIYHPLSKQVCLREAGCFWGRTIIERLIPIQRRYNALKNRIHEYLNRVSVPAWTVEQDSIVDKDGLTMNGIRSGDVIERIPGSQPPAALQMPQMTYDMRTEEQQLRDLMTEISGVSDFASQSYAPAGTPAAGIDLINQQDDSRISLTSENIEIAAKEIGKKWLWLYKKNVQIPRLLNVVGEDHTLSYILEWTANNLTSFDVTLETEGLLATSIQQKRQQVTYLFSQGLFNDPSTGQIMPSMRAKLFEMFELGNWQDAVSLENIHIRRANEENMKFKQGLIAQVNQLDDDDLHVREHTRFVLTTEESSADINPEIFPYLYEHIELHKQAAQQKMMQGQAMLQAAQMAAAPPQGGIVNE